MEAALPRSSEQTMWVLLCNTVLLLLAPHGVGNHWETCTHPSTARQSHTPTLTLNGFSAFFPLRHQCDRPRSPPRSPERLTDKQQRHISRPMNNATVTALWSDALNTKTHCEVSGPPSPPLSCKLGVHDVFDRRNYVACRFLFDKCSAGDVCRWFFRVAFNRSKSNFWSLLSTVRQRQKKTRTLR